MPIANTPVTVTCGTNTVGVSLTTAGVAASLQNPVPVTIYNPGAAPVFIGGPNVTLANGVPIAPLSTTSYSLAQGDQLYGVCATVTTTINLMIGRQ